MPKTTFGSRLSMFDEAKRVYLPKPVEGLRITSEQSHYFF